jgi:ABC-2 type transporter
MVAIIAREAIYGVVLLTFVMLLLLSFTGFLITTTPVYFRWLGKISYLTFAYNAMLYNELDGASVCPAAALHCDAVACKAPLTDASV